MENGWRGAPPHHLNQSPGPVSTNTAIHRMLQEQQGKEPNPQSYTARLESRRRPHFEWPPRRTFIPREAEVRTFVPLPASTTGLKKVTWPPPPEDYIDTADGEQEPVYAQEAPAVNGFASPAPQYAQQVTRQGRLPQQQTPAQSQGAPQTPPPHRRSASRDRSRRSPWTPPPTVITLRQSPPIHQEPAPVVVSQPATARMQGGVRARGDAKWPPQEYKTRADEENAQRVALAKGPVCRPRLPKRDYSGFFEQNRVNAMYPGYRPPPGTQHYVDETGVSEF